MPKTTAKTTTKTETSEFVERAKLGVIQPGLDASHTIHVRVVSGPKGDVLDIRQHVKTERYTGYTSKGVSIPLDQAEELFDLLHEGDGVMRNLAKMIPAKKSTKK